MRWNPADPTIETENEIRWSKQGVELGSGLEQRWQEPFSAYGMEVYIPAGRALYSFLPPASALRFVSDPRRKQQWPGYITLFYETLGTVIRQLWQDQEQPGLPFYESRVDIDFFQSRIESVMKGKIHYGPETVLLSVGKKPLRPETIAYITIHHWISNTDSNSPFERK